MKNDRLIRSLYDCAHARVKGDRIVCCKAYPLSGEADYGLPVSRLATGAPLLLDICQLCGEFSPMGKRVRPKEKGWLTV